MVRSELPEGRGSTQPDPRPLVQDDPAMIPAQLTHEVLNLRLGEPVLHTGKLIAESLAQRRIPS